MAKKSKHSRSFFERAGRLGGKKRAQRLSSSQRSLIAAQAARARWGKTLFSDPTLPSTRLSHIQWSDPVYLEEVLSEGSLEAWRELYVQLADHPFGLVAQALQKVLAANLMYGITPLWKGLLHGLQNH